MQIKMWICVQQIKRLWFGIYDDNNKCGLRWTWQLWCMFSLIPSLTSLSWKRNKGIRIHHLRCCRHKVSMDFASSLSLNLKLFLPLVKMLIFSNIWLTKRCSEVRKCFGLCVLMYRFSLHFSSLSWSD